MSQSTKKTTTAKLASDVASKATKSTYEAVESSRATAENVVKIGSKAVKELMSSSTYDPQKAKEKAMEMTLEGSKQIVKSADKVTKALFETITMGRDNVETAVECGNLTAAFANEVTAELYEAGNRAFSDNLELSKEFFSCRTFSDIFELQNRFLKTSLDNFFNESIVLSSLVFEYSTESLEPINERVSQASDQLNKALSE